MEALVTPIQLRDHAALFLAWWSLWSLADKYLIPFTPISEIVVLLLALSLYAPEWLQLLSHVRARQQKLVSTHIDRM
jgi:hypothetical protein